MKIHSHYCATDDDLSVYLPVRFYELKLKHRLLEQLGGFSHLLLDALTLLPEQGIDWVLKVTGLNPQQLQPILNRLDGLGLMNRGKLSQRGERLTAWKRLLHGQTRHVWLDGDHNSHSGHHNSHSFCGDASLDVMELHEDAPFVIRRWHKGNGKPRSWPCDDWNEDCERQKNRILRSPDEYLGAVFETFRDCFIGIPFSVQEWDLNVRYVSDMPELLALEVPLDPADLMSGSAHNFVIASRVICLETRYRLPDGAPVELLDQQPEDQLRAVSFGRAATDTELMLENPPSSWSWPEVDETVRRQAVELLFKEVALSAPQAEAIFNRDHCLVDRWQSFGFDWSVVEGRLQEIEGIHLIKGDK